MFICSAASSQYSSVGVVQVRHHDVLLPQRHRSGELGVHRRPVPVAEPVMARGRPDPEVVEERTQLPGRASSVVAGQLDLLVAVLRQPVHHQVEAGLVLHRVTQRVELDADLVVGHRASATMAVPALLLVTCGRRNREPGTHGGQTGRAERRPTEQAAAAGALLLERALQRPFTVISETHAELPFAWYHAPEPGWPGKDQFVVITPWSRRPRRRPRRVRRRPASARTPAPRVPPPGGPSRRPPTPPRSARRSRWC